MWPILKSLQDGQVMTTSIALIYEEIFGGSVLFDTLNAQNPIAFHFCVCTISEGDVRMGAYCSRDLLIMSKQKLKTSCFLIDESSLTWKIGREFTPISFVITCSLAIALIYFHFQNVQMFHHAQSLSTKFRIRSTCGRLETLKKSDSHWIPGRKVSIIPVSYPKTNKRI